MLRWVLDLVGSPWTFVAVAFVLAIGGTITILPTQSLVVAVTTLLAAHGDVPFGPIWLFVAATIGMVAGDFGTYWLVRGVRLDRIPGLGGERVQRMRASTRERFDANPAPIMTTGRFIPMGRILTNVAASDARLPPMRFGRLSLMAAMLWSAYSILIGSVAGVWAADYPVTMLVVAVGVSIVLGVVFDRINSAVTRRRAARVA